MLVLITSLGLYASVSNPGTATAEGYAITTSSGASETALAKHLQKVKAKMYGSFTCEHCHNQKELFGKEAAGRLNYIECNSESKNARIDLCEAAKLEAYPSWEINGKLYRGEKSLQELADLSGYRGDRNFRNTGSHEH